MSVLAFDPEIDLEAELAKVRENPLDFAFSNPGVDIEVLPLEAERLGAFEETALTADEAAESVFDDRGA